MSNALGRRLRRAVIWSLLLLVLVPSATHADGLPADWHRGAAFTTWRADHYATPAADESLEALRATGTDSVAVVTTWYMQHPGSTTIEPASNSPTEEGVLHSLERAKELGFRVVMKPHIGVKTDSWSAAIRPADTGAWFESFRAYLYRYADLAERARADMLVLGTEYTSMMGHVGEWRAIIAEVKRRFSGQLTFAAAGIEDAEGIAFWDELDYIGVDAYMPLSDGDPNPSVDEIAAAWHRRGYVDRLARLAARWRKPILFTELGYYPHEGTVLQPSGVRWDWPISQEAQRRAYEAFYRVFNSQHWFRGVYWWDWRAVHEYTTDYSPRGLPAEQVMRHWNATVVERPPVEPAPAELAPVEPAPAEPAPVEPQSRERRRLSLRVVRRRGAVVLRGSVVRGSGCDVATTVSIRRWDRRRRVWVAFGGQLDAGTRRDAYIVRHALGVGSYRVKVAAQSDCYELPSRRVKVRIRR